MPRIRSWPPAGHARGAADRCAPIRNMPSTTAAATANWPRISAVGTDASVLRSAPGVVLVEGLELGQVRYRSRARVLVTKQHLLCGLRKCRPLRKSRTVRIAGL